MEYFKNILGIIIIATLLFFLLDQCSQNRDKDRNITKLLSYKSDVRTYKTKNNELVEYNLSMSAKIDELRMVEAKLMDSIKKLRIKKPEVITEIVTEYKLKEIPIHYKDSIPCDTFTRKLRLTDKYYDFALTSQKDKITLDSLTIYNSSLIVVGEKKNGLFKRNEKIVVVQNSNPYIKTKGIKNYTIKPDTKWHDKLWFKTLLFGLGVLTGTQL